MHFKIKRFLFPLLALLGSCDDNPKDPIVQFKQMKYESQESKKSLSDALFKTYPDTMDKINPIKNSANEISKLKEDLS